MMAKEEWVARQRLLLLAEKQAEIEELIQKLRDLSGSDCEKQGISLLSLTIDEVRTTLFGRCCITIKRMDDQPLRKTSMKVGDEVTLFVPKLKHTTEEEKSYIDGVIIKATNTYIDIICGDDDDVNFTLFQPPLRLDLRASEQTHKKMMEALNALEEDHLNPLSHLLFASSINESSLINHNLLINKSSISYYNKNLNASQQEAIKCALDATRIALIHGPPGTGKTSTITELILQASTKGQNILVCAPSNVAVDNILERLVSYMPRANLLRIGHPARVNPKILSFCLDAIVSGDDGTEIVRDIRDEMDSLRKKLTSRLDRSARKETQVELKSLRKEIRQREEKVISGILASHNIVLCTCIGASSKLLKDKIFDLVVIDEAAQALEASCWVPILKGAKLVLAGDHKQLPPTIKSTEKESRLLSVTLFERIIDNQVFASIVRMLTVQYRMNNIISTWASHETYHDLIESHETVRSHKMVDLVAAPDENMIKHCPVMLLLDTAGGNYGEETCNEGSHRNFYEADLVLKYIETLLRCGIQSSHIGVITPYNGQIELLRQLVQEKCSAGGLSYEGIDIKTVDGFQGGEKECIILSLVRSNDRHEVGFLADPRRINVAVTRARRNVTVICDTETCSVDKTLNSLINYIGDHGVYRSILEFSDTDNLDDFVFSDDGYEFDPNECIDDVSNGAMNRSTQSRTHGKLKTNRTKKQPRIGSDAPVVKTDHFQEQLKPFLYNYRKGDISHGAVSFSGNKFIHKPFSKTGSLQKDSVYCLRFSSSLNPRERAIIHETCEEMNLYHQSQNDANDPELRYIEVSLVPFKVPQAATISAQIPIIAAPSSDQVEHLSVLSFASLDNTDTADSDDKEDLDDHHGDESITVGGISSTNNKKKKKKKKSNTPAAQVHQTTVQKKSLELGKSLQELDEDAALEAAIKFNQEHANYYKYRIGSTPFPNPEKISQRDVLRAKITESQKDRTKNGKEKKK